MLNVDVWKELFWSEFYEVYWRSDENCHLLSDFYVQPNIFQVGDAQTFWFANVTI